MSGDGRRVVLFPFTSESHTTAMLQLAALLRARGLAVTVLHTDLNAPEPSRHHPDDLAFVSIHESLPAGVAAACLDDPVAHAMALNDACTAPFHATLAAELTRATDAGEVCAAVVDAHWYKMLGAAARAGVPALAFCPNGAAAFLAALATPRDQIGGGEDEEEAALRFAAADAARANASAVVINTFDAIEAAELAMIRRELPGRPAFAVGPLHLLAPPPQPAPANGGDGCLAWLDARPPRSVIYVNLGGSRAATVDRAAFVEMAWGLAGSGVPFLWVLPPGSVHGGAPPSFPEELEETARRRGKVVAWAPQRELLAHPAVGAFWTGCGWSSTMEAVCEGVPMLVQPCSGGGGQAQAVVGRHVARRWGTGLEIGRVVERTAVARTIRRLMAREIGLGPHAPRERARLLKLQARQCVAEGGPASLAIDELVEYMLSL